MATDDLDIPNSFEIAAKRKLKFSFEEIDLRDAHPNSVKMVVTGEAGRKITSLDSTHKPQTRMPRSLLKKKK